MRGTGAHPPVVDNTVLNRFAKIGRFDLLQEVFGTLDVLYEVQVEAAQEPVVRQELEAAIAAGWIVPRSIRDFDDLRELAMLCKRLGRGESACIIFQNSRGGGVFLTDDKKAWREASRRKLVVHSSLWTLYESVQRGHATPTDVDRYIAAWKAGGARLPSHVNTYQDLLVEYGPGNTGTLW